MRTLCETFLRIERPMVCLHDEKQAEAATVGLSLINNPGFGHSLRCLDLHWQARREKLKAGRLLGRFFAASRERLREAASHLRVHHLANLGGCPARSYVRKREFPSRTRRHFEQPIDPPHRSCLVTIRFLPPSIFRSLCAHDPLIVLPTPRCLRPRLRARGSHG